MTEVLPFSGLFLPFLDLSSDVFNFRGSHGTIGLNNCDTNYRNRSIENS